MTLATTQGKAAALQALAERREQSRMREHFRNETLPAGSPVYLPCIACGALIMHPETYLFPVKLCAECDAMKTLGWLV